MDWIIETLEQVKDLRLNKITFDKHKHIDFGININYGLKKIEFIYTDRTKDTDFQELKKIFKGYHRFLQQNNEKASNIIDEQTIEGLKKLNDIFKQHNLKLDKDTRNTWELGVWSDGVYLKDYYYEYEELLVFDYLDEEEVINEFIKFVKGLQ